MPTCFGIAWGAARRRRDEELAAELESFADLMVDDATARGVPHPEARRWASQQMGGRTQLAEQVREVWPGASLDTWVTDARLATRALWRRPAFAAACVLTLALGIGVNGASLSVAWAVLFEALPYPDAERLVTISEVFTDGSDREIRAGDVSAWTERLQTVTAVAGFQTADLTLRSAHDAPRVVRVSYVTPDFFRVLDVRPLVGTTSDPHDRAVAVVSTSFARSIARDAAAAPRVHIGDRSYTVIGVMPPGFDFPAADVAAWLPAPTETSENSGYFRLVARLKPGVTVAQLSDDAMRVLRDVQGPSTRNRPLITNVDDAIRGDVRPTARAALVAAVLVLIIACANVANLLSAHVLANRRDYATQLALGAPRRRVIRRVLLEALCVAVCAAAVGLWLAWAGVRTFGMVASGLFPRVTDVGLGPQVLGAIVGLTIVAALFSGIVPALTAVRAEGAIGASLTAFPTLGRARGAMIACQVALTLPLLFGAGLLARTVTVLLRTDPGFDATHGVAAKLVISDNSLVHGADHSAAFESMLTRLRAFPTVRAAGVGTVLPPRKTLVTIGIRYIGEGRNEFRFFKLGSGTPGFLSALGARFLRGRDFTDQDVQVAAGVAVISESAARHLFGDRDPIGERINRLPPLAGAPQPTVVGVVSDIKFDGLDAPVAGAVYVPWTQLATGTTYVVVRGHEDPMQLVPTIRQILRSSWPHAAIPEIVSLNQAMSESVAIRQLRSGPAVMLALVAVLITFAGVLGTFHRVALERRRELAIRRALGATSQDLLPLFVRAGAMIVGGGVAVGVVLAVAIGQCLASQLYGVESNDPALLAASAAVLVATACLGFYLPFRRVLRLNPSTELQCE